MWLTGRSWVALIGIFVSGILIGSFLPRGEQYIGDSHINRSMEKCETNEVVSDSNIVVKDIELVKARAGQVEWRLWARSAEYSQDSGCILVVKPRMLSSYNFYNEAERREVYIQAERGTIDQHNNNLAIWDCVEGRYGEYALKAKNFDYIGAMNKLLFRGGVQVWRPDMSIDAMVVEIDLGAKKMMAAGRVLAFIAPRKTSFDTLSPVKGAKRQGVTK